MKLDATPRRLAAGLALALLLGVGTACALLMAASARSAEEGAMREARVMTQQLAELVAAAGLEPGATGEVVRLFAELHSSTAEIRVVDLQRKRLLASTAPGDQAEQAAPRRLSLDEKPLYDLGQELRAAVEANLVEARAWKPEIATSVLDGGVVSLAAPVEVDGEVRGTVLLETTAARRRPSLPIATTALALLVPMLVFLGLGLAFGDRLPALTLLAAAVLVLSLVVYTRHTTSSLVQQAMRSEAAVADDLSREAERFRVLLAEVGGVEDAALDPQRWDVDVYRLPSPRADLLASAEARRLTKLTALAGLASLLLLLVVGVGGATRLGRVLVKHRRAYAYAIPALAGMILLVYIPFTYGLALAFTNANIYNSDRPLTETWVGLDNFGEILGDLDVFRDTPEGRVVNYDSFYWTAGFTIVWTVANVSIGVSVGLLLALILHRQGLMLKPVYRVIFILPWAVPNYITSLIWKGMFHSQLGVINQIVQIFGAEPVSWFESPGTSFLTVLATNGWLSFPFMMVISLGALQSIPADLYEAAEVDGASAWQRFASITLPSLKPALVPAVIVSVIWTFNMFNIIYLVSGGQPAGATEILVTKAYKIAFEQYRYGYAAAYSTLIFLMLLTYGVWQNRVTRATEGL